LSKVIKRGRPKQDPEIRRRQILNATVALFAEHGYQETNIQDVADSINLAKGTIYIYFKTKEELFLAAVEYAIERLAESIDNLVVQYDEPIDKIKAFIRAFLLFIDEKRHLASMIVQEGAKFKSHAEQTYYRVYKENTPRLENIIQNGVEKGDFRDQDPVVTTEILANLLSGTMYAYVVGSRDGKASDNIEYLTKFLMTGMLRSNGKGP